MTLDEFAAVIEGIPVEEMAAILEKSAALIAVVSLAMSLL